MTFYSSRPSDRAKRLLRGAGTIAALTAFSAALVGISSAPALAQDPNDTIGVTYQSDGGGENTITGPVTAGGTGGIPTATVVVPDAQYSADDNSTASLDDGSAFVVTPTIDPELRLFYTLVNRTSSPLTVLTFTLQEADGYYYDSASAFTPRAGQFDATFDDLITGTTTHYRSLIFTAAAGTGGLTVGGSKEFSFAVIVPATTGQSLGVQLRPNDAPIIPFDIPNIAAPEPGSASLILLLGTVSLPIAGVRIRRRRLSRLGNSA
jgi:hypothetical protein